MTATVGCFTTPSAGVHLCVASFLEESRGFEGSTYLDVEVSVYICSHAASILACAFSGLSKASARVPCISSDSLASQPSSCPFAVLVKK